MIGFGKGATDLQVVTAIDNLSQGMPRPLYQIDTDAEQWQNAGRGPDHCSRPSRRRRPLCHGRHGSGPKRETNRLEIADNLQKRVQQNKVSHGPFAALPAARQCFAIMVCRAFWPRYPAWCRRPYCCRVNPLSSMVTRLNASPSASMTVVLCARRQVVRTRFADEAHVDDHGGQFADGGVRMRRDADDVVDAEMMGEFEHFNDLARLAAGRAGDDDVALVENSQIAVGRVARVNERRRRAVRAERAGDFLRDGAGLA